ncbi:MAG: membrane protein required for colicin V production [Candidatus Midichloriaceae bacterium]|jgi:membrane protein required for colicin V production
MQNLAIESFNYIDYASFVIIGISILFAFYRGFISSAISLMGWILSIILTYEFYPFVEQQLSLFIKSKIFVVILGSSGLLIFMLLLFGIINSLFYKLAGDLKKSFMDRSIGALFGLIRGFLIVSFLFLCFSISLRVISGHKNNLEEKDYPIIITNAVTFELIEKGANSLESLLPDSLKNKFAAFYTEVSKQDVDERFIQNSINKLTAFASHDEVRNINLMRQDMSVSNSQEQIEMKTLEYLLNIYKDKLNDGQVSDKIFTSREIQRLEKIIKEYDPNSN